MALIIDYRYYPFIGDIREIMSMRWPGLRLHDVVTSPESPVRKRIIEIVRMVASKTRIPSSRVDAEVEVISFYGLLAAVKTMGDRRLAMKIAVSYSKHAWQKLREEPLPVIAEIARLLGIDVELVSNPPRIPVDVKKTTIIYRFKPFSVSLIDYLKYSSRLSGDPKYALVNQLVKDGRVFLEKPIFVRILQEAIYKRILEIYDSILPDEEHYKPIVDEIMKVLQETGWLEKRALSIEIESTTTGVIDLEAFPPCMKMLLDRLVAGENLGHHERFTLAAFMARIGMDIETMLGFFRHAPDFNEKIARYQLEHIAGLRGSRKKYMPYNCDTMKSYSLCPIQGYCEGGKNPLAVYKRNVWKKKKSQQKREKA